MTIGHFGDLLQSRENHWSLGRPDVQSLPFVRHKDAAVQANRLGRLHSVPAAVDHVPVGVVDRRSARAGTS
jgi:hypothetical protein